MGKLIAFSYMGAVRSGQGDDGAPTRDAVASVGVEQKVEPSQNGGVMIECGT